MDEADTDSVDEPAYAAVRRDGVLCVRRSGTEWLSTGWDGGRCQADRAYNISVPEEWARTDLEAYTSERIGRAGFNEADSKRPVLLTGVDIADARGARCGSVTAYATAGISNPAALPMNPDKSDQSGSNSSGDDAPTRPGTGTVNLIVGTTRALASGALANLIAVAAEAKAATLLAETGFPGTTTDAIVVGHDLEGESVPFSGTGTEVGGATRACVREAVRASLQAHYAERTEQVPASVDEATHGVSTTERATVFRPGDATTDGDNEQRPS
ncbi:adenosylcobinamide amidohydrolase [Natronolimnobius sp. AArcel1]|uniref:adenosylcobinamide amidohydrolase n=1 Tax=Natronolimnobius sp. AArcel1 TaxID=1679093 RepID=UPI0013ED2418|nr:adenosylcobinamide amidohydrolase [Natronolimnobius sp. AArcel1]NGM67892.1 adenosylcobinamide amidohydrolase [Natronolimnobius sp. AArcel1]